MQYTPSVRTADRLCTPSLVRNKRKSPGPQIQVCDTHLVSSLTNEFRSLTIHNLKVEGLITNNRTMSGVNPGAAAGPILQQPPPPPGGATGAPPPPAPVVVVAPQLPLAADSGTITGWILDHTLTETSAMIAATCERVLNQLTQNVPDANDPTYGAAMRVMTDEVISSDTLVAYLTVCNLPHAAARVTVVHSIGRYSAGFGGNNSLHGRIL